MRIAYLMLVHKNPVQVGRLIEALRHKDVSFFIHIDKKTDFHEFCAYLGQEGKEDVVQVRDRTKVCWCGYSTIEATLRGMRAILASDQTPGPDYIFLLSGQHYPLKPNKEIFDFLGRNYGHEFLSYAKMPTPFWIGNGGMYRLEQYHFQDIRGGRYLRKLARRMLPKRKYLEGFTPYGGSQWWCLSYNCVRFILDFVAKNRKFANFYRYTFCPDEMFFQTIVLNSSFADKVLGELTGEQQTNELVYFRWDETKKRNPKILCQDDFEALLQSEKLFARKFDIEVDHKILDLIDEHRREAITKT